MPLINCKIHLELDWTRNCIMSNIADTTLKITNTKLRQCKTGKTIKRNI